MKRTQAKIDRQLLRLINLNPAVGAALADDAGNLLRLALSASRRAREELDTEQPDWTLLRVLHRLWKLAEGAA